MRKYAPILVILALLFSACGGDGDDSAASTTAGSSGDTAAEVETTTTTAAAATETTAAPEITAAPETTAATLDAGSSELLAALAEAGTATSGRMEGSMTIIGSEGMPAGTEISMTFSGAFDDAGNSSFIMDMSDIAGAAPAGEEIPAEFADLFGEMEIRTIGDTTYMRFGLFTMFGIDTEWVSMSAEDAGSATDSFGANPINPMDMMDAFGDGNVDVEIVGTEDVRGVATTHYRLSADVEAMMAAADEDALDELDQLGPLPGDGTIPVEFWVGDDGRVYQMSIQLDGADDPDSGFGAMEMIWQMYDYGADIAIEAPPAEQVSDGSNLTGFLTP